MLNLLAIYLLSAGYWYESESKWSELRSVIHGTSSEYEYRSDSLGPSGAVGGGQDRDLLLIGSDHGRFMVSSRAGLICFALSLLSSCYTASHEFVHSISLRPHCRFCYLPISFVLADCQCCEAGLFPVPVLARYVGACLLKSQSADG